jgi:hypothetical protein
VPWVYTRRVVARNWGCLPWEVDAAPIDEVLREIELHNLEIKHQPKPKAE